MSLKNMIGKVFSKKETPGDPTEGEPEVTIHEVSFKDTMVEKPRKPPEVPENEIDVYVHDEKIKIYQIKTETHIGRDPSQTQIAIPELIVSKFHCTLHFKDKDLFIKDNNSTNGTYVNNEPVTDRKLEDNDIITLGKKGTVRIVYHKRIQDEIEGNAEKTIEETNETI